MQVQTDAHRMPLENASVIWPERLSPSITSPVACRRSASTRPSNSSLPQPLLPPLARVRHTGRSGTQNRARKVIYYEMSKLRQGINGDTQVSRTGAKKFP